eukprot:m.219478 g.219478  ORF g.219478 m.219478 type:complete len:551 (+) comp17234_c0_seq1:113-1765(+)
MIVLFLIKPQHFISQHFLEPLQQQQFRTTNMAKLSLSVTLTSKLLANIYAQAYETQHSDNGQPTIGHVIIELNREEFYRHDAEDRAILTYENLSQPSPVTSVLTHSKDCIRYIQSLGASHVERLQSIAATCLSRSPTLTINLTPRLVPYEAILRVLIECFDGIDNIRVNIFATDNFPCGQLEDLRFALEHLSVRHLTVIGSALPELLMLALFQRSLVTLILHSVASPSWEDYRLEALQSVEFIECSPKMIESILRSIPHALRSLTIRAHRTPLGVKAIEIPNDVIDEQTELYLYADQPSFIIPENAIVSYSTYDTSFVVSPSRSVQPLEYRHLRINAFGRLDWEVVRQTHVLALTTKADFTVDSLKLPDEPLTALRALYWRQGVELPSRAVQHLEELDELTTAWQTTFPNASLMICHYDCAASHDYTGFRKMKPIMIPNPNAPITLAHFGDILRVISNVSGGYQDESYDSPPLLGLVLACEQISLKVSARVLESILKALLLQQFSSLAQAQATIDDYDASDTIRYGYPIYDDDDSDVDSYYGDDDLCCIA